MDFGRLTTAQRITAASIVVTIIAAFLPWVSLLGISKLGIEGDGVITLILAIAGGAVLVITSGLMGGGRTPGKASQVAVLVLGALSALIGLVDLNGAAAIGLYLTFFAGIAWIVGAAWQMSLSRQAGTTTDDGV